MAAMLLKTFLLNLDVPPRFFPSCIILTAMVGFQIFRTELTLKDIFIFSFFFIIIISEIGFQQYCRYRPPCAKLEIDEMLILNVFARVKNPNGNPIAGRFQVTTKKIAFYSPSYQDAIILSKSYIFLTEPRSKYDPGFFRWLVITLPSGQNVIDVNYPVIVYSIIDELKSRSNSVSV